MADRGKCPVYGCGTIFELNNFHPDDRPGTLEWSMSDHLWVHHDLTQRQAKALAALTILYPDRLVSLLYDDGIKGIVVTTLREGIHETQSGLR